MAAGIVDILSHLMERYFPKSVDTDLSDSLIEATMKTVVKYGSLLMKDRKIIIIVHKLCGQQLWHTME